MLNKEFWVLSPEYIVVLFAQVVVPFVPLIQSMSVENSSVI